MKLALWRKLAATYPMPELPGWTAGGWVLHGRPQEWFAPTLVAALSPGGLAFSVNAVVQFLPVPKETWSADNSLEAAGGRLSFDSPSTVDDAAPCMADASAFIRKKAIPFLDRWSTVEARLEHLRRRAAAINEARGGDLAWQDVNVDEEFCYAHLIAGDRVAASQYSEYAARSAEVDPRPWAQAARERVARVTAGGGLDLLREQADATRAALRVPR